VNRISRRVAMIAESATLAIDGKAKSMVAAGRDVVVFGAGEPDFPTPPHIVEAAQRAAADPRNHRYTATAGLPPLREAVAEKTRRDSGLEVSSDSVLITNGAKQAIYNAFATLLDPGDEVLVPTPYWVTYPEAISLAGGVPVEVPTDETSGFRVTIQQLEAARSSRTKVLLFVSPGNPTGAVYPPSEVEKIGDWAARRGLWVVTDEIYEHLVYGDNQFHSLAPLLSDRYVIVNGVAKTFAMTGWRVGWMVGPPDVIRAATNLQSHATSNVGNVAQMAALAALTGPMDSVALMRAAFDRRRRTMYEGLAAMPGVVCREPEGAFYAFPSLRQALATLGFSSSIELAAALLEEAGVAIVPGEAFGAFGYARLSYALGDADLVRGLDRLEEFLAGRPRQI
jgi:aspartate/methionine/tyrosine aminotransferase